ncbi:DUF853 family protein [bacterium]|nr:DUF853 family protein [bacterium]
MWLGREVDSREDFALEACHLVTHGVILGMTGAGKTGLAITMLEELINKGVPLMIIDPKGELANLGLLFPEAQADQLEPWFDSWQSAADWAQRIQEGRSQWDIDPARVASLSEKLELHIYTPGSRVGHPLNLLGCFQPPNPVTLSDEEARANLLSGLVQGLLALVGEVADPLRSAEALVLCQIIDQAWEQGQNLTLEGLIRQLVDPPFRKIGVFPVETFYPAAQRLELATKLNALVDSPAFSAWSEGECLDIHRLQQASQPGRVPVSLFYLSHLSEAERMFFVTWLLHHIYNWSRQQPAGHQLRSLLYLDEAAGYMPPHPANPASKQPLLTLLKQSDRGLGVVMATQNIAEVDYKGLASAGTWWVGRMQSAIDRQRVAKGLALAASGIDGPQLQKEFEQLQPRHFLVKRPEGGVPIRVETRFTASLMRGPVKRSELSRLHSSIPPRLPAESLEPLVNPMHVSEGLSAPPPLPTGFAQAFLDPSAVFSSELGGALESHAQPHRDDGRLYWRPALWGEVQLHFDEKMGGFSLDESHHYLFFPLSEELPEQWLRLPLEPADVLSGWNLPSCYENLPTSFDEDAEFSAARQAMLEDVFERVSSSQWVQPDLKLYGGGGESELAFRRRVQLAIEERIDQQVAGLQTQADQEITAIQDSLARYAEESVRNDTQRQQSESLWTAGASVLGFFTGKKRALSAPVAVSNTDGELEDLQLRLQQVQSQLAQAVERIQARESQALEHIQARPVRLERESIRLSRFGVLWIPVSRRI